MISSGGKNSYSCQISSQFLCLLGFAYFDLKCGGLLTYIYIYIYIYKLSSVCLCHRILKTTGSFGMKFGMSAWDGCGMVKKRIKL